MDLTLLLDYVIPSDGVLHKQCNGGWCFYKSDDDFIMGNSYMHQSCSEDVHHFLERLIQQLIKEEEGEEEPLVTIDYAIWSNFKDRLQTK